MSEYGTLTLEVDGVALGPTTSWSLHGTFKNPEQWPFGTIVENTKGTHTVMVVRDEGDTFVAMQLKGSFVIGGPGRIAPGWPKRLHAAVDTP